MKIIYFNLCDYFLKVVVLVSNILSAEGNGSYQS